MSSSSRASSPAGSSSSTGGSGLSPERVHGAGDGGPTAGDRVPEDTAPVARRNARAALRCSTLQYRVGCPAISRTGSSHCGSSHRVNRHRSSSSLFAAASATRTTPVPSRWSSGRRHSFDSADARHATCAGQPLPTCRSRRNRFCGPSAWSPLSLAAAPQRAYCSYRRPELCATAYPTLPTVHMSGRDGSNGGGLARRGPRRAHLGAGMMFRKRRRGTAGAVCVAVYAFALLVTGCAGGETAATPRRISPASSWPPQAGRGPCAVPRPPTCRYPCGTG